MSRSIRLLAAPLALTVALTVGACGDHGNSNNLAQDSTLSRDLALANRDSTSQPQLSDTATAPASKPAPAPATTRTPARTSTRTPTRRPAPKPTPKPTPTPPKPVTTPSGNTVETGTKGSAPSVGQIGEGSVLNLTSNQRVCTNTNHPGDRFTATVTEPVVGSNGAVIPKGAKAVVQVSALKRSEHAGDPVQMSFVVQSVSFNGKTYPVSGEITNVQVDKVRSTSTSSDVKKVAGGAIAGAIIGQILGHNTKSTVIGAATGAAAGTAVAMGTANYEGCIPQGGSIQIKLDQPVSVQTE